MYSIPLETGGDDIKGNTLPVGVYICRFVAGNKTETGKIVKAE